MRAPLRTFHRVLHNKAGFVVFRVVWVDGLLWGVVEDIQDRRFAEFDTCIELEQIASISHRGIRGRRGEDKVDANVVTVSYARFGISVVSLFVSRVLVVVLPRWDRSTFVTTCSTLPTLATVLGLPLLGPNRWN